MVMWNVLRARLLRKVAMVILNVLIFISRIVQDSNKGVIQVDKIMVG